MFGVQPLRIKVATADADGRLFVGEIMADSDARFGPPRHMHYEQDEWFYVTQGNFLIEVGGEQFDGKAGDSIFAPRMVTHTWASTGEEASRMVFTLTPAGPFESFARAASALGRLPTPEEANEIFESHQMKITGPPLDVAKTSFEGA